MCNGDERREKGGKREREEIAREEGEQEEKSDFFPFPLYLHMPLLPESMEFKMILASTEEAKNKRRTREIDRNLSILARLHVEEKTEGSEQRSETNGRARDKKRKR
jgi:hypothetical protein